MLQNIYRVSCQFNKVSISFGLVAVREHLPKTRVPYMSASSKHAQIDALQTHPSSSCRLWVNIRTLGLLVFGRPHEHHWSDLDPKPCSPQLASP